MNIFLIFNFSANLAIIFDFADESIVFHEYAGAYSRPACRARTSNQMTDIAAGGQSATRKMTQPISAQSKTSSSTSSQIDRTCCQDGSQRTFTHSQLTGDMTTDLPRPKSEDLHESQGKIQGGPGGNALDLR